MANVVTIEAETRARAGKGAARATWREGKVPGVIYGGKQEPESDRAGSEGRAARVASRRLAIPPLRTANRGRAGRALIRGVQFHPVTDNPIHVDFQRLMSGEKIKVSVPVHFENDGISPG